MKDLQCVLVKPVQPNFCAPKVSSMVAPASKTLSFSSLSVASMALSQPSTKAGRRSLKPAYTASSVVPSATEPTTSTAEDIANAISPKKVLVPIGYGTEEMEAVILVDVLRRAGAEVIVASVEPQLEIEASCGTRLIADTSIATCSDQVFDLIALPGGMPGAARLRDCEILKKITSKQAEEKRLYGAICAAPAITLLPWGLLRRKRTTCHPAFKDKLPTFWAVKSSIQVSGELTTSRGPGTCFAFAVCLVDQLFGESVAKGIGELLLMNSADCESRLEEFNKVEWSVDCTPRVLVPVANGSEEIELVTIIDILRRAKVDVVVASVEKSIKVSASQGIRVVADKFIGEAAESTYDAIIVPGGVAGTARLQKSRILKKLLKDQQMAGRIYGAVNSSVTILHRYGLLTEKRAAADPSSASKLAIEVDGAEVVIDGKLITGRGLEATIDFALVIVSKLFGHSRGRSVAEGLVFEYPRSWT